MAIFTLENIRDRSPRQKELAEHFRHASPQVQSIFSLKFFIADLMPFRMMLPVERNAEEIHLLRRPAPPSDEMVRVDRAPPAHQTRLRLDEVNVLLADEFSHEPRISFGSKLPESQ